MHINYTPLAINIMQRRARRCIRAMLTPVESQIRQLRWILYRAAETEYGKQYRLDEILHLEDPRKAFAERLEIHDYEHFRPYIMRMVDGEKDVLWPGSCTYFAQSSGTSGGRSKYIPITTESLYLNHYAGAADSVALYLRAYPDSRMFAGKGMILGGSFATELHPQNPKAHVGDLSATLIDKISPLANIFRIPDKQTALLADWEQKLDLLARKGMNENVTNISGVPSWFLTVLKRMTQMAGKENVREVWPELEVFFHGGINFEPYRHEYEKLIPGRMRYWESYNASEGFFASQSQHKGPLTLLPDATVYYEFLPLGGDTPLMIEQVQPGHTYELIITAPNGLYRYRTGDTITIIDTDPVTIRIAGRTKAFINAFGEELMENNAERAIAAAQQATGASITNYTAGPEYPEGDHRGCHRWLIEWSVPPGDIEAFADILDRELRNLNSDYDAKRTGDIFLDRLNITSLPKGTFERFLTGFGNGKLGGQRKVPRLSNTPDIINAVKQLINEKN